MIKSCSRCRQELASSMFKPSSRTKDGLQVYCKICAEENRIRAKERYTNIEHRKKKLQSQKDKYDNDPSFKERKNKTRSKNQLKQYHNDPDFKEKLNKTRSKNQLKQYHNDPNFKVHVNISSQIRQSLKLGKQNQSWELLVGYSLSELMKHIEAQFKENMNWNNYGEWHIDHRTPKSWFEFESIDDENFKECWKLDNLKPMWASENIAKGNRYAD